MSFSTRRLPAAAAETERPEDRGAAPAGRHRTGDRSTRREQILDGASEMFAEHGYDGASLRHIAAHVGISHPGMLHHFPSKDALLGAVIDRLEAHAQAALDHVDDIGVDAAALFRALDELWNPASHPMQLLASLDAGAVSRSNPGRFRVARLRRVHEHILEQCFTSLDGQGLLREGVDRGFAGRALLALVLSHAVREKTVRAMQQSDHDDVPLRDLTRLTQLFLHHPAPRG
ncbi:TetR/AcrR family transcriptional regulator [Brachybacterium sp. UNK5269]|uniref:TetR/AcrR family transcriptional regulator n=1 Tax=Brachybacterium sp. UNK5269 TaxID=3408576 RepID=UPI003BB083D1